MTRFFLFGTSPAPTRPYRLFHCYGYINSDISLRYSLKKWNLTVAEKNTGPKKSESYACAHASLALALALNTLRTRSTRSHVPSTRFARCPHRKSHHGYSPSRAEKRRQERQTLDLCFHQFLLCDDRTVNLTYWGDMVEPFLYAPIFYNDVDSYLVLSIQLKQSYKRDTIPQTVHTYCCSSPFSTPPPPRCR